MTVISVIVGATTDSSAVVVAQTQNVSSVRLAVDTGSLIGPNAVFFGPQAPSAQGMVRFDVTSLDANTQYIYQLEGDGTLEEPSGKFRTHPPLAQSGYDIVLAMAGDGGRTPDAPGVTGTLIPSRMTNHPVHTLIADMHDPLMFIHLGDEGYYNIGSGEEWEDGNGDPIVLDDDLDTYRRQYEDIFLQPNLHHLARNVSRVHVWDDHEFGGGPDVGSDKTLPSRDNACLVYREREAHYPLPAGTGANPVYHSFQIGRVLFVALDTRSDRDPNDDPAGPSKTMLGTSQRAWLDDLLTNSTAEALVVISSSSWLGVGADSWASYEDEQGQLVQLFTDTGFLDRMILVNANTHFLAIDDGSNNDHGGFPVFVFAPLDSSPTTSSAHNYPLGFAPAQSGQYGTLRLQDDGTTIRITGTGWQNTSTWNAYTHTISTTFLAPPPPSTTPPAGSPAVVAFAEVVSGSHDMVVEARVLTSFQTGTDPIGTTIPIVGGDVSYDATAEVFASLDLETIGIDETTGRSWFPRFSDSLLAPYGNELFVRRGVDTGGGGILWSPLGYFRIETVEQVGPHSESNLRISGQDRMGAIIEAELLSPREYGELVSIAAVFADLVGDVYPDAVITFDDSSGTESIGRRLVVDESRYDPLLEMADALGKVMYFDGEGVLRIEDAPEDDTPVWRVAAGRGGVMVSSSRRVTREGAFNAVVVLGEGGGGEDPVRGVAVDRGPQSPTRWGGRFGRVPRVETLPQVTTASQAAAAARQILRRNLGAPYSADFSAVPNPALRPRMPVVVVQRDGNRELHVVETLSMPLTAAAVMPATTRERTHVVIGADAS